MKSEGWEKARARWHGGWPTLFAKTVLILALELAGNALLWIVAAIVFTRPSESNQHRVLGLALVAWTTGLRHGLDADHISVLTVVGTLAIDNATRRIVSVPQLGHDGAPRMRRPVTVGLFFSLGHSTIVVTTTVIIAISAGIADKLDVYGNVGGIIGAAISGSFLVLIGCINTAILYRTWSRLGAAKKRRENGSAEEGAHTSSSPRFTGFLTRLAMPLLRTVDRPWKLYPVGLLFGLGFDTASSIALLSVAVIAQQEGSGGSSSRNGNVVLLALLFTAGMTLVDSADSCLMIWAYAPDLARNGKKRFALWERNEATQHTNGEHEQAAGGGEQSAGDKVVGLNNDKGEESEADKDGRGDECSQGKTVEVKAKQDASDSTSPDRLLASLDESASRLSLVLTLVSILIAFAIGIIVLLGLIGDQCARCSRAADRQEEDGSGGLEGRWWLAWRQANDNSGYVGAAIVGLFALAVAVYFSVRCIQKRKTRK